MGAVAKGYLAGFAPLLAHLNPNPKMHACMCSLVNHTYFLILNPNPKMHACTCSLVYHTYLPKDTGASAAAAVAEGDLAEYAPLLLRSLYERDVRWVDVQLYCFTCKSCDRRGPGRVCAPAATQPLRAGCQVGGCTAVLLHL